ncbi:hypothetical protein OAN24_03305 [Pseudodesulfovibrio sp.]|nr:hypothetical protein [Pseudodesulfovibrio sp.]
MNSSYPSDYEDVFQLIMNLVEEVKQDVNSKRHITAGELENYFHRLTLGTLGEYEFTRRMASHGHPVMRIAALPVLWKEYSQPVSPDFIVDFENEKICVEVKNYKWDRHQDGLIIPKRSVHNCGKFKKFFNFDKACLAVKRFERWYMFDLESVVKKDHQSDSYLIEYSEMSKSDMLNEQGIILQLWSNSKNQETATRYAPLPDKFRNEGIIYHGIYPNESQDFIRLKYCSSDGEHTPSSDDCETRQCRGTQMDIVKIVYQAIESNLKEVYSCGYDWQYAVEMNIEDIIPSVFSIHDRLRGGVSIEVLETDIDMLASSGIMYKSARKNCLFYLYRIASKLHNDLNERLQKDDLNFKDIMKYMQAVRSFKNTI